MRRWLLIAIMLLAAILRLRGLGHQSLWYDEALTLHSARAAFKEVPQTVDHLENMPPTYFYLMNAWRRCFGTSEFALRLPSALCGIASVAVMYLLVRRLFGRDSVALLAALLLALSRYHVAYSQEARAYSVTFLLTLVSCYTLAILACEWRRSTAVGYVGSTAAMLWIHPFSVFVLAAQAGWKIFRSALCSGQESPLTLRRFFTLQAGAVVLFGPYVPTMLEIARRGQPWMPRPHVMPTLIGYADTTPLLAAYVALALVGLVLAFRRRQMGPAIFCLMLAVVPVAVPLVLSQGKHPIFTPRYGIPALVGTYALVAYGIGGMNRKVAAVVVVAIVGLAVPNLARDFCLGNNAQVKANVRDAARDLSAEARAGDLVMCPDFAAIFVLRTYLPHPKFGLAESLTLEDGQSPRRVWLLTSSQDAPLECPRYVRTGARQYQGLVLQTFEPNLTENPATSQP